VSFWKAVEHYWADTLTEMRELNNETGKDQQAPKKPVIRQLDHRQLDYRQVDQNQLDQTTGGLNDKWTKRQVD
jgi:hypothetical protein